MLNINNSMERFERDLHIDSIFSGSEDLIPLANPKIYVRPKWKPPAWDISLTLKLRFRTFRKALEPKFRFVRLRGIWIYNRPHKYTGCRLSE